MGFGVDWFSELTCGDPLTLFLLTSVDVFKKLTVWVFFLTCTFGSTCRKIELLVVWSYEPLSIKLGMWISLISLVFVAAVAHIRYWHPERLGWTEASADRNADDADQRT